MLAYGEIFLREEDKLYEKQLVYMKKVRDFMNPNVIYLKPEESVFNAAKILAKNNISGAPVVENNKVVGIVSESDIIKFMNSKLRGKPSSFPSLTSLLLFFLKDYAEVKKEIKRISRIRVGDIMSKKIVSISPEASLFDAASLMERKDVNRLPVIEEGKLIGIITRADLIRALLD